MAIIRYRRLRQQMISPILWLTLVATSRVGPATKSSSSSHVESTTRCNSDLSSRIAGLSLLLWESNTSMLICYRPNFQKNRI